MKANFHTHNYRCGHAEGDVEDYVKEAIKEGYAEIGISDHSPLPKYHFDRMGMNELEDYLGEIREAQRKYKNKITIYKSLEIEYFEDLEDYYRELAEKLDYLLLGLHTYVVDGKLRDSWIVNTDEDMLNYAYYMEKAMKSKLFQIAAHPDLYMSRRMHWNRAAEDSAHIICQAAAKTDTVLEINANGIRKNLIYDKNPRRYMYPYKEFWEIAKQYDNRIIISSDCHEPWALNDEAMELARKFAEDLGLKVIETIF